MNGLGTFFGFIGILSFAVGLAMFLPIAKLHSRRRLAKRLSAAGLILFVVGLVITPNQAPSEAGKPLDVAPAAAPLASPTPGTPVADTPKTRSPDHNYLSYSGRTYYYAAAISPEEAEQGRTTNEIFGFEYAGRHIKPGNDTVFAINSAGMPTQTLWCDNPCSIVHSSTGQMLAYDASSIIGMVFQDIMDGKLKSVDLKPISPPHAVGSASIYTNGTSGVPPSDPSPTE